VAEPVGAAGGLLCSRWGLCRLKDCFRNCTTLRALPLCGLKRTTTALRGAGRRERLWLPSQPVGTGGGRARCGPPRLARPTIRAAAGKPFTHGAGPAERADAEDGETPEVGPGSEFGDGTWMPSWAGQGYRYRWAVEPGFSAGSSNVCWAAPAIAESGINGVRLPRVCSLYCSR